MYSPLSSSCKSFSLSLRIGAFFCFSFHDYDFVRFQKTRVSMFEYLPNISVLLFFLFTEALSLTDVYLLNNNC